jgi:hypothetical protein
MSALVTRLDDVDVAGRPARVRPQTDVDLLRPDRLRDGRRRPPQQRTEDHTLGLVKVGNMHDMAQRLDDERPEAERTDAALHHPTRALVDPPTRQRPHPGDQLTRDTSGTDQPLRR